MVKIVHVSTVHSSHDTRIFHKECKTIHKGEYDISFIVQNNIIELRDGIKILPLKTAKSRIIRLFSLTWRAFFIARRENAEIYHFHDPELLSIGLLLKIFTKGKVIYDVHEDVPKQILTKFWIPSSMRPFIAKFFDIYEKQISKTFDAIITVTDDIAQKFSKLHPIVVHNYPDLHMLPPFFQNNLKKDGNNIVYIGGISEIRGIFEMIKASEHLNSSHEIHLNLIGGFESISLRNEVEKLKEYKNINYFGYLPWTEAWHEAKGMKAGLVLFHPVPNHLKSLPNKLFEYMAAGIPVIASNFPLWEQIIEKNHCGLIVDPLNPREIAAAIEFIITHPEEARIMGENGHRAVIEKYNWEKEGEKLLNLYMELLNT